jgi:sugar phosphate isomerase/epimerase
MLEKCILTGFADEIASDINDQILVLTSINQSYLEFRGANGKGVAGYSEEEAAGLKKLLDNNRIKVSAIGSPIGKISITEDFEKHFEAYQHIVKLAKIFNTRYIRIFSFYIPQGEDPALYKQEVFNRMRQLVDYAGEQDIHLLHENEKDIYGDNEVRCLELMEEFYGEHFWCIFDFANFVQCGVDTVKAYHLLRPYINYIHIKDAMKDTKEVVPPGHGDGHLTEILKDLDKSGYQGFLSLEPHLADFIGLRSLERDVKERKKSDGEAAYLLAYRELLKILNS